MLKEFINASGKTDTEWAGELGISRAYLSLLKAGHKRPSLDVAIRIERATDGAVPATSWVPDTARAGAPAAGAGR